MEAGTQDGPKLTQLADFWLFEHMLVLPSSIATDEMVNHLGSSFSFKDVEAAALPAPISARMFLRYMRNNARPVGDWQELLDLLGLMCQLSCKRHQYRSHEAAAAVNPSTELLSEALLQVLCSRADRSSSSAGGQAAEQDEEEQQQPLTAATVHDVARKLLESAEVLHIQDDELLQNRLSLLEQLLRGRLPPGQLQKHLAEAFPVDAVEEQLTEYLDRAWMALGQTTLQLHQESVLGGAKKLPFDPVQHFATLLPVDTQAVLDADMAAAAAGAAPEEQQQPQQARRSRPVPLLGEATAPLLGSQELEAAAAGSSQQPQGKGRGRQQAPPAAASPQPKAAAVPARSPQAKASPAAAAVAAADGDAARPGRRPRAAQAGKPAKEVRQEAAAAAAGGSRPSRKQLDLAPTSASAPAAAAAAGAAAASGDDAGGVDAAAGGGKKGRASRRQQQADAEGGEALAVLAAAAAAAEAAGNETMPPPAAAPSGGRKRGRRYSPSKAAAAAAAAAAASAAGEQDEEDGEDAAGEQPLDSSQPNVTEGVQPAAAPADGKGGSLASAFLQALNKPLDGLAAAAGGLLAASLRGSPAGAALKDRKLCGAAQEGAKGRTVPWESPFGGSMDSPEVRSPGSGAAAAAAAAGGGQAGKAFKRKRAQADGQRGLLAAAKAAGVTAPDSGNTVYQDAREEPGSEAQSQEPPGRSPRQRQRPQQRDTDDDDDDDSSIDDPESDEFDDDLDSDDVDAASKQKKKHPHGHAHKQQQQRKQAASGRPGGHGAAAAAAAGGGGGRAAADPDFDELDERGLPKKRRKFQRWTAEEEQLLIQLVAQEGEGQWALIHRLGGDGFNRRTQVDLKDKWRNLKKKGAGAD